LKFDTKIRIQKGIPIPPVKPRGMDGRTSSKYPWREMEVGDSFLFPAPITRQSYAAARQAERLTNYHFAVRRLDEGYRCWRVA
jgi:hypothetical protein